MMKPNQNNIYQPPETSSGDLSTPVRFIGMVDEGWMPDDEPVQKELYFCMAEMYQASIKDYEIVNTTNAQFVVTILIPNPRQDYIPKYNHHFEIEDLMYQDAVFNIESIAPKNDRILKIVGVAYER